MQPLTKAVVAPAALVDALPDIPEVVAHVYPDHPELDMTPPEKTDFKVSMVTDIQWLDAAHTGVKCKVTFPNHPGGFTYPLAYHLHASDKEEHGQKLFKEVLSGRWGKIAEYVPDLTALSAAARVKRNQLITATDWTQMSDVGLDDTVTEQYRVYRKALRDITDQPDFPFTINWPKEPV